MKKKKEKNPKGTVLEALGNARFRVEMQSGDIVIAYLSCRMKVRNINIFIGDTVEVKLDLMGGKATNRIVWRK
jgi:translation initiation factor IF-1